MERVAGRAGDTEMIREDLGACQWCGYKNERTGGVVMTTRVYFDPMP